MITCRFCGEILTTQYFQNKEFYACNRHRPSRVGYKPSSSINNKIIDSKWIITYNDYRLTYFNGRSCLYKINRDKNDSSKDYYSLITSFDHELKIRPEDFVRKLPTLLTFS